VHIPPHRIIRGSIGDLTITLTGTYYVPCITYLGYDGTKYSVQYADF
jgi:hypothetical protein